MSDNIEYGKTIGCGALSLPMLAFALLFVLKVAEVGVVAHWSWWWVTCPLWILPALLLSVIVIIIAIVALSVLFGIND